MTIREIEWTVGGSPVDMADWQAGMVAPGGFDRFTGSCQAAKVVGDQGAPVIGYRPDGTVLYYGEIVSTPKIADGIAFISAQGSKARMEKFRSRFPYQIRNYSLWAGADADPYGYTGLSTNISFSTENGQLKWEIAAGQTMVPNEFYRAVLWTPGFPIYRIAGTFKFSGSLVAGKAQLKIETARGPSGSVTVQQTLGLSGTVGPDFDKTFSSRDDMVCLSLVWLDNTSTTLPRVFRAVSLLVNDWAIGDHMSPSDVAIDLGSRQGFDTTGVKSSAPNCLPLDFLGTGAEMLTYIDQFDNFRWLMLEPVNLSEARTGYKLARDSWDSQEWRCNRERGATPDLEMLELFNKVTLPYTTVAGSPATISILASPDPLAQEGIINEFPMDALGDQQTNDVVPTLAAQTVLDKVSTRQVRGSVQIARLWGDDGEHEGWDLTAGGMLSVTDHDPQFPAQRIVGVTYQPGGIVTAALTEDVSADALLARVAARTARRQ